MDILQQEKLVLALETAYINATAELGKLGKIKRYKINDREMEYVDFMKHYEGLRNAYERELKKLQEMKGGKGFSGAIFAEIRQDT